MESIGAKLAGARDAKGVSITQAARDTHIAKAYIEALEEENFDALPGKAYLLGFLRNYAGYLGLNAEQVVTLYHNIQLQEQPAPISELLDTRPSKRRVALVVGVVAAIVVVGVTIVLFATGAISLPRRTRSTEVSEGPTSERTTFTLQEQFVERQFFEGDRVVVPVDGQDAVVEFLSIGDHLSVGSDAGIVQIAHGEDRILDLTGEGSGDVRLVVRQNIR